MFKQENIPFLGVYNYDRDNKSKNNSKDKMWLQITIKKITRFMFIMRIEKKYRKMFSKLIPELDLSYEKTATNLL